MLHGLLKNRNKPSNIDSFSSTMMLFIEFINKVSLCRSILLDALNNGASNGESGLRTSENLNSNLRHWPSSENSFEYQLIPMLSLTECMPSCLGSPNHRLDLNFK